MPCFRIHETCTMRMYREYEIEALPKPHIVRL